MGCDEIKLTVHSEENVLNKTSKIYQKYFNCTVSGTAPKLADWKFIAKLDHDYKTPIISTIPRITVPEEYHGYDSSFDHCKTNRYRRMTYVVQNIETQEYKHIGKSCLKDFLGHKDPKQILSWFEWFQKFINEFESGEDCGFATIERYNINDILEISAMIIDEKGTYISKGKAQYIDNFFSTTDYVSKYLWDIKSRKAFDFEPIRGRHDQYIEGTITERIETVTGYFYNVDVTFDSTSLKRTKVNVPLGTFFDFDNRIIILAV